MPAAPQSARQLYSGSYQGVLSTLSRAVDGYPFGSVVAFAPDRDGRPVVLISRIAEHTRNLLADPRASLIVTEAGDDLQAGGRVTVIGDAAQLAGADEADAAERYFRRFPHARDYLGTHDFNLFRIVPRRVRFIGGFGRIHWVEPDALCLRSPFSEDEEAGMVNHMNADHADAIRAYCALYGFETGAEAPRMTAVDGGGFDLMLGKRLARIEFDAPVATPVDVRKALVALVQRARGSQSPAADAATA